MIAAAASLARRRFNPRLGANGCVTVTSTATGSVVVHRSTKISAGHSRPSTETSLATRIPEAAMCEVKHLTMA